MGLVGEELFCRTHRFNVNALELASVAEHATLRFLLALVAVTVVLRQSKVMLYCRYGDNEAYALELDKGELDSDARQSRARAGNQEAMWNADALFMTFMAVKLESRVEREQRCNCTAAK